MTVLRREVMVPMPSYRRPSSLIGLSIVLVLLASAVDAVVWTYQARRAAEERAAFEMMRPTVRRWHAAPGRVPSDHVVFIGGGSQEK